MLQLESAGRDEQKKRIADMGTFLREQPTTLTEYDEPLARRLIEKVTVYEDKIHRGIQVWRDGGCGRISLRANEALYANF